MMVLDLLWKVLLLQTLSNFQLKNWVLVFILQAVIHNDCKPIEQFFVQISIHSASLGLGRGGSSLNGDA